MVAPELNAFWSESNQLYVFCWHCGRWHAHGPGEGHRVAHCQDPSSPYHHTGYFLRPVGPLPEDLWNAIASRRQRADNHYRDLMSIARKRRQAQ